MHTRSSSVQTYRSFNQFVINHLKDFILNNIQTINFLLSRLYYDSVQIAVTEKASSRFDCEQSLPFLLRHFKMKARARSEGEPQSLLLFCTFKLTALGSEETWNKHKIK